jgi:competence protein ComEC
VLAIGVSYVSMILARIPAAIAGVALQGIAGTVQWLGGLRLADIRVATPSLAVILCSGLAIIICVLLMRRRVALSAIGIAALAATAFWIWTIPPRPQIRPGVLEMTAIDVGQGDSILLVTPEGRKLLVDAGGMPFWAHSQLDIGEDVVSTYLWARGISRIDAIALTHAHSDHMGGMAAVIANFRPREFWLPEGIPDQEIKPLLAEAKKFGVAVTYHKAGDAFRYGGTIIRVLAPNPGLSAGRTRTRRGFGRAGFGKVGKPPHGNDESLLLAECVSSSTPRSTGTATTSPRHDLCTDANGATTFYLDGKSVTSQLSGFH